MFHTEFQIKWLHTYNTEVNNRYKFLNIQTAAFLREVLNRKKKCEISHLGGGVWTSLGHFHTFFLLVLIHSNQQRKVLFWGGGVTTSPEHRKISVELSNFCDLTTANICSLTKTFVGSCLKKKCLWVSHFLEVGGFSLDTYFLFRLRTSLSCGIRVLSLYLE